METHEYSCKGVSIKYTCECGVSSVYYPAQLGQLGDGFDNSGTYIFARFYSDEDIEKEVYK